MLRLTELALLRLRAAVAGLRVQDAKAAQPRTACVNQTVCGYTAMAAAASAMP